MPENTSPAARTIGTTENADDVLGQFYCAFAQGAGTMRVAREAVAALRHRYFENIKASPAPWSASAGSVLPLLTQVGRLAALLATQAGHTAITAEDFIQARRAVEAHVHPRANDTRRIIAGSFCTVVPGEDKQDEISTDLDDAPELGDEPMPAVRAN